jgi:hypothetical protein
VPAAVVRVGDPGIIALALVGDSRPKLARPLSSFNPSLALPAMAASAIPGPPAANDAAITDDVFITAIADAGRSVLTAAVGDDRVGDPDCCLPPWRPRWRWWRQRWRCGRGRGGDCVGDEYASPKGLDAGDGCGSGDSWGTMAE